MTCSIGVVPHKGSRFHRYGPVSGRGIRNGSIKVLVIDPKIEREIEWVEKVDHFVGRGAPMGSNLNIIQLTDGRCCLGSEVFIFFQAGGEASDCHGYGDVVDVAGQLADLAQG